MEANVLKDKQKRRVAKIFSPFDGVGMIGIESRIKRANQSFEQRQPVILLRRLLHQTSALFVHMFDFQDSTHRSSPTP